MLIFRRGDEIQNMLDQQKFQHMLDEKFWHFWDGTPDASIEAFSHGWSHGWDKWLEENKIRKVRYSEDGSEYSKICMKYRIKATDQQETQSL